MRLFYFVRENLDGSYQAQESQASFGGEHDHPAEIVDHKVVTYARLEDAQLAVRRAANEARCSPDARYWRIDADENHVSKALF